VFLGVFDIFRGRRLGIERKVSRQVSDLSIDLHGEDTVDRG
jgi:hypothetical protein